MPGATPTRALAVIPARLASTRFPEKLLADATGRPLIAHVCERAGAAETVERVVVAADDQRLADAVAPVTAILTRADHPNGTSRIGECVDRLGLADDAIVVNVQGDEPEIEPSVIDACVNALSAGTAPVSTVASPIRSESELANPNIVKVVTDADGHAMYFSRAPIPLDRDGDQGPSGALRHVGIYGYRAGFLRLYQSMTPTPLERLERLEQLRVLEHGHRIAVARCDATHEGIDTPEQYEAFVRRFGQSSS